LDREREWDHDTQFLRKIHSSSLAKLPISSAAIVLLVCLKEIMREELKITDITSDKNVIRYITSKL
jgi:hypothetical protein